MKLLLFFISILVITSLIGCWSDTAPVPQEEPDITVEGQQYFWPEYDYMSGYDVFPINQNYAFDAFEKCSTNFYAFQSDIISIDTVVYSSLRAYVDPLVEQSNGVLDYKCYLFALNDATGKPVDPDFPNGEILGLTSLQGVEGEVMTFIFVQAVKDKYPNDDGIIESIVIHELGHMRAALSHSCYYQDNIWHKNTSHNSNNCVMSPGAKTSPCTLSNISNDFCSNDRKKISEIKW